MIGRYILNANGDPEPCDDLMEWGTWIGRADRHLARDIIDGVTVSTVFLGLDHAFGDATPILWETMIFGGPHDEYQERYSTRADALAGHERAKALVSQARSSASSSSTDRTT